MRKSLNSIVLAIGFATLVVVTSCQKEKAEEETSNKQQIEYGIGPVNPNPPDSILPNAIHQIPLSIRQIMNDEDYNCCYDTTNYYHSHAIDTSGFYTYAFPSLYFENQWLIAVADDAGLVVKYVWDFEDSFDYNTYYQNNTPAYVTAYTDDFTQIFFIGQVNLRTNELYFTYINSSLWEEKAQPGYGRFCRTWSTIGYVYGAGCLFLGPVGAIAGLVIGTTTFIVDQAVCQD
jgi:hypothetical protein